jgi:hypothetical protein
MTVADELQKLQQLHESGAISDEGNLSNNRRHQGEQR